MSRCHMRDKLQLAHHLPFADIPFQNRKTRNDTRKSA
jgi:hypothetical protein